METLASVWVHDPSDLRDLRAERHEPPPAWESGCVFDGCPPAGLAWTQQLSPHLQRNKQLQDTLLQREEELARLQEENNKLREFLGSSFVRNLQQKAKKLTDGRKLKRNLTDLHNERFQATSSKQASKRVCRNLTAQFCSESSERSACSEPNLDLWVLRTLGLKDRDTIDTSGESSSECSLGGSVYDAAVTSSPSSEYTSSSSFSSPVATSTPSHVHYCQTPGPDQRPGPDHLLYWSLPQDGQPPTQQVQVCPVLPSSPGADRFWTPAGGCSPASPSAPPQTPRTRTDLAFSMSLSPSSSVKTHSFPQGQAFIRRDAAGGWNFTWVPRQEP